LYILKKKNHYIVVVNYVIFILNIRLEKNMTTLNNIKKLREETGIGILECKKALTVCDDDIEKAKIYIRKQGTMNAKTRGHKQALEGIIGIYNHVGGKICAIVEVNCETDFVSKNSEFKNFAHDLALHIVASSPKWISRSIVPQHIIDQEIEILSVGLEDKPDKIKDQILNGQLNKFYKENCLMEQPFVKNPKLTIQDLYNDLVLKLKENIIIKKFERFEVGK